MNDTQQLTNDINDLKQRYDSIIKKLESFEKENSSRDLTIKRIENGFEVMNNNMKELMEKIDLMIEDRESHNLFNKTTKSNFSFVKMITMPLKKVTISTMSSLFTIADYASEKAACARESMEDIIAEAQYESKKKKAAIMNSPLMNSPMMPSSLKPNNQC